MGLPFRRGNGCKTVLAICNRQINSRGPTAEVGQLSRAGSILTLEGKVRKLLQNKATCVLILDYLYAEFLFIT